VGAFIPLPCHDVVMERLPVNLLYCMSLISNGLFCESGQIDFSSFFSPLYCGYTAKNILKMKWSFKGRAKGERGKPMAAKLPLQTKPPF